MQKLIEFVAKKISLKLCESDQNKENYDYYEYALIGYLCFIKYCITAIIFSFLLGYFPYIFIIIPCLLGIRSQSGGSHAKTPFWCFLTTTIVYIAIGLSTYLNKYFLILFLLSFISFTGLEYIPKYTRTAIQHSEEKQRFFQLNYVVRLFVVFILNILCIILFFNKYNFTVFDFYIDFSKISCVLSSCALMNRFSLSDLSFKLLDFTGKDIEQ